MSMMGELKFFLGIQIHQSPRGIFINQAKYAQEILVKHGMTSCDSIGTPMATKHLDANLSETSVDQTKYRSKVGDLIIGTPMATKHLDADLSETPVDQTKYRNSNHAGCLDSRKVTSGGIQFLGGDKLVSWSSKNQDSTSMSSAEAEYVSLSACCTQVIWMRTQLIDCGFYFDKIPMYYDSKAAIAISCNPVQHSHTKHIDVRYHLIKEKKLSAGKLEELSQTMVEIDFAWVHQGITRALKTDYEERRASLEETVNKYLEESAKKIEAQQAEEKEKGQEELIRETQEIEEAKETMIATTSQDLTIVTHYVPPYEPPIPFLGHLAHHAKEAFMSSTMKSLREIRVNLSSVTPRKFPLPPKEKDPGCFIVSCSIGNLIVRNALADLGESVSIMPLSMFKRSGVGKLKPINMNVEMADRTKSIPKGIEENLLVKIDKFIFPVDFVIVDMVKDYRIPVRRSILATAHAEVDVFGKLITLEVVVNRTMSSPNHPTSNIEDAFSSNFLDFIPASPDYVPTSPGKTYSSSSNSFGVVPITSPSLSLFHNDPYMKVLQAFYTEESPIPPPNPISPPVILTPSLVLPPSPLFDPRYFFVPEELLLLKKKIHPLSSSSTTLSNSSRKRVQRTGRGYPSSPPMKNLLEPTS
nr:hypothetical protein [Tanacetum cinerariifolium]